MATWIKTYKGKKYDEFHDCINSIWDCTCSECGWRTGNQGVNFDYCPKCGTRMENAHCSDVMPKEDVIALLNEMLVEFKEGLYCDKQCDNCKRSCEDIPAGAFLAFIGEKIQALKENTDGK